MTYLHLKITGAQAMHGRLPGEEFYVRCDGSERPVNSLWAKRLSEEAQHNGGYVSVIDRVSSLPTGARAIDDPVGEAPRVHAATQPQQAQHSMPNGDEIEQRILAAVARALAGIRAEALRAAQAEIANALKKITADSNAMRTNMALIADAWRVRATLPPGWQPGMPVDVLAPPLIEAYASMHHSGDVALAAMSITEADDQWQIDAASMMRARASAS